MAIRERLIDLERHLRTLIGEPPPREPLEIRQAILDAATDLARPAGAGRRVLPFDRLDVDLLAETADARRVLEAVLGRDAGLTASVLGALASVGCVPAPGLDVRLRFRRRVPAGWAPGQRFTVTGCAGLTPPDAGAPAEGERRDDLTAGTPPAILLRALKGRVARKTVALSSDRINVGRGEEVLDRGHRLVRRNQFVFLADDPASDTVSRAHAHIRCAPSGECRLRDDGSAHGTRIVRAGRTIEVSAANTRGVRLRSGDEIHFGRAVARFDVAEDAGRR